MEATAPSSEGLPASYLEHIVAKTMRNARRKTKFKPEEPIPKRRHRSNLTGTYHDELFKKGPKYWHKHRPERINNPVKSYDDLANAINAIAFGDKNFSNYHGVSGINRDRLRVAQAFQQRGIGFGVYNIMHMSREELMRELSYSGGHYGKVLYKKDNRF